MNGPDRFSPMPQPTEPDNGSYMLGLVFLAVPLCAVMCLLSYYIWRAS